MIKDVLIIGLGAIGAFYASLIPNAKILVDEKRKKYYEENPTIINGTTLNCEYILPDKKQHFDLIIISTKHYNLEQVLENAKNQIDNKTKILSFINGITSEDIIKSKYPMAEVIPSYIICNSVVRSDRIITHDNTTTIVIPKNIELEDFFNHNHINYRISTDIKFDLWQKFMLNITANQLSALTKKSFGELNKLPYIERLIRNILHEVVQIAGYEGVKPDIEKIITVFKNFAPECKTSMLQDIENNRQTEVEIFAGEIIKLGKKYNIKTPYNDIFYALLTNTST